MAPPCRVFPASQLPTEIQLNENGKRRKGGKIDLSACELLSMVQYDCQIDRPELSSSPDQKGEFFVETTVWEGRTSPSDSVDKEPRDTNLGGGSGGA
ncbi:hypothetical protein F5Y09DRAFT_345797 [Xylaria sp. FL1042]|nr:hypothetical protein F5Y09DRAFT_345797 [Xylaria sp. FL1042]